MAFDFVDPEEEQKNQDQNGAPISGGAPALLGEGGPGATGQGPAPTNSGWTNLKAYLDANGPQAAGLADQVSGNITSQGDAAKKGVQDLQSGYQTNLKANTPQDFESTIQAANVDPAGFAKNPDNVSLFGNLRQGLFNAPAAFESTPGYGDVAKKADEASALPSMAQNSGGQQTLIRQLNPQMTQGNVDLNQLLLGGDKDSSAKVSAAAAPYAGVRAELDKVAAEQNKARDTSIGQIGAAKDAVTKEFVTPQTESLNKLETQINQRVQDATTDNKNNAIKSMQDFVAGKINSLPPGVAPQFGRQNLPNYDTQSIKNDAISMLQAKGPTVSTSPELDAELIRNVVLGYASPDSLPQRLKATADQIQSNIGTYDYVSRLDQNVGPDWMDQIFPGTKVSEGDTNAAGVTSPDEYAKILALQQLLGNGASPFLTEDQKNMIGSYKAPTIGMARPPITNTGNKFTGTPLLNTGTRYPQFS